MEYALREGETLGEFLDRTMVLILVLMEYALRVKSTYCDFYQSRSLNPCFNGICSARKS